MRMHDHRRLRKVVWAVDPFEDLLTLHQQSVQALGYLEKAAAKESLDIQPVFVMNASHSDISPDLATPWTGEYQDSAREKLKQLLSWTS
jgi:hypothetical protein